MRMFHLMQTGVGMVAIALLAIVHISFAFAVKRDADYAIQKRNLFLVSPGLWAFATLLGGVTVAVAYWAIHYSTLRPQYDETSADESNQALDPTSGIARGASPEAGQG